MPRDLYRPLLMNRRQVFTWTVGVLGSAFAGASFVGAQAKPLGTGIIGTGRIGGQRLAEIEASRLGE